MISEVLRQFYGIKTFPGTKLVVMYYVLVESPRVLLEIREFIG